jgi:hypothetical protein
VSRGRKQTYTLGEKPAAEAVYFRSIWHSLGFGTSIASLRTILRRDVSRFASPGEIVRKHMNHKGNGSTQIGNTSAANDSPNPQEME